MIEFKKLGKNVLFLKEFFEKSKVSFCDISLGVKYMWRDKYQIEYAIHNDTLILKETCPYYSDRFYLPMGEDFFGALTEIESYAKLNDLPLSFCCVDNVSVAELNARYPSVDVSNDRDWSDYIYDAENFKEYHGKKFGGQKNHENKFKRLFPDYEFKIVEKSDCEKIKDFIKEYQAGLHADSWSEKEEWDKLSDYVERAEDLGQNGGYIETGGKVVAISYGEKINDTLIIHVEKGLRGYDGVYPTMAQEFAKAFCTPEIKYINREEDCGDMGLRISKLQYHPIEVKEKNNVLVKTGIEKIENPVIKTERLTITDILEEDKEIYKNLYLDENLNKFWGYDYHEDLKGEPTADYFYSFSKSLIEKKEEYDFAIRLGKTMIGELCLYNFDYFGNAEIGFRLRREYQKKGYAEESANALILWARDRLKIRKIKAKCFIENTPSEKLIIKLGLKKVQEDETYRYFEKVW